MREREREREKANHFKVRHPGAIVGAAAAFIVTTAVLAGGCRSEREGRLDVNRVDNPQEGQTPSPIPAPEPADFFRCENSAGDALESFRNLGTRRSTATERQTARDAVEALNPNSVSTCLLDTFGFYDTEGHYNGVYDAVFYMAYFPTEPLRAFLAELIEVRGVAELQAVDAATADDPPAHHTHKYDRAFGINFWAMRALENGYNRGLTTAMEDLLRIAANHPYGFIRRLAVLAIERSGTAGDRDALRTVIRPEDAYQLNPPESLPVNPDVFAPTLVSEDDELTASVAFNPPN